MRHRRRGRSRLLPAHDRRRSTRTPCIARGIVEARTLDALIATGSTFAGGLLSRVVRAAESRFDAERRCLERLADSAEPRHVTEFATLEADPDALSAVPTSLVDAGCIDYDHLSDAVRLGHLGDRGAIIEAASVSFHLQDADLAAGPLGGAAARGRPMRRVPSQCVLPQGHAGRCRNKR